jgi:hypothetical protein
VTTKWEYALDIYSYEDGGLAALFHDQSNLDRRRDDGWWLRETFRGLKGVEVLWEREIRSGDSPTPAPGDHAETTAHGHAPADADQLAAHPHSDVLTEDGKKS